MVRAGNGLRGHLLQAMVQAKQRNGNGIGAARHGFGPSILQQFGLGTGVGQKEKLQALLARVQHGVPGTENGYSGGIHGFGPGGVVTGTPSGPQGPTSLPEQFDGVAPQTPAGPAAGGNDRAGDVTHMPGYAKQTGDAAMWEQRHPAAVAAGHIPNWVMEGLTNALNSASGGDEGLQPTHIQTILQHLSAAMAPAHAHLTPASGMPGGAGGGNTLQPPPQSYN